MNRYDSKGQRSLAYARTWAGRCHTMRRPFKDRRQFEQRLETSRLTANVGHALGHGSLDDDVLMQPVALFENIIVTDKAFSKPGSLSYARTLANHTTLQELKAKVLNNVDAFTLNRDLQAHGVASVDEVVLVVASQLHLSLADNTDRDAAEHQFYSSPEMRAAMPDLYHKFPEICFESIVEQMPMATVCYIQPSQYSKVFHKDFRRPVIRASVRIEDKDNIWVPERSHDNAINPLCRPTDQICCTIVTDNPSNVLWQGTTVDVVSMVGSATKKGLVLFIGEHRSNLSKTICTALEHESDGPAPISKQHIWSILPSKPPPSTRYMDGKFWTYEDFLDYSCAWQPHWGPMHAAWLWHKAMTHDACFLRSIAQL